MDRRLRQDSGLRDRRRIQQGCDLIVREALDVAQRELGILGQRREGGLELNEQPLNRILPISIGVIEQMDTDLFARHHENRDRIVALLQVLRRRDRDSTAGRQGLGDVLEHEKRVKQSIIGVHRRPRLDAGEGCRLMDVGGDLVRLETLQQDPDGLIWIDVDSHRKAVDEHPDDVERSGELGRTSGNGRSEHHRLLVRVACQEETPCSSEHRAERDSTVTGESPDSFRHLPVDHVCCFNLSIGPWLRPIGLDAEVRACLDVTDDRPPMRFGTVPVLLAVPGNMTAERHRFGERFPAAPVHREDLLQHDPQRPSVQDDVVVRPDEPMGLGPEPKHCEPHQRRLVEDESASSVVLQESREEL